MRIMIIGAGKLGMKVAASLVSPDNYITLIDINPKVIQKASNELDVLAIAADALEADIYSETYQEIVWDMKRVRFHERIEKKNK